MATRKRLLSATLLITIVLGTPGCKRSGDAPKEDQPPPAEGSIEPSAAPLTRVLQTYETIRSQLADDRIADVASSAASLQQAAEGAAKAAPPSRQGHLRATATASQALAATSPQDAAAVRKAFGEVSRGLVALLEAEPTLAPGRHLFECPMAEGYKKWIQTSETISNPYMGKSMLSCGAPVSAPNSAQ